MFKIVDEIIQFLNSEEYRLASNHLIPKNLKKYRRKSIFQIIRNRNKKDFY